MANKKIVVNGNEYVVREVICVTCNQFENILDQIYGKGSYDWDTADGAVSVFSSLDEEDAFELSLEDDLSKFFGKDVSSVHTDNFDYGIGIWIVFAKEAE